MSTIWNNIIQNEGFEIAGIGILLVFSILILVSLTIGVMPKVLRLFHPFLDPHPAAKPPVVPDDNLGTRDQAAAAAAALHYHFTSTER
jgi:Na+-transporting methylmalonyl-CoA/oxaloacetate decarboxylase gamma subunit